MSNEHNAGTPDPMRDVLTADQYELVTDCADEAGIGNEPELVEIIRTLCTRLAPAERERDALAWVPASTPPPRGGFYPVRLTSGPDRGLSGLGEAWKWRRAHYEPATGWDCDDVVLWLPIPDPPINATRAAPVQDEPAREG